MGLELPEVPEPVAAYVPGVKQDRLLFTSGQIPTAGGELKFTGKVGKDLTIDEGYEAARLCALNALAVLADLAGGLENIERILKVTGFVNSAPGFSDQPKVVNGASELFGELFGEAGEHARSAVASNELPLDSAVEVEVVGVAAE
jgi:enamine deaminase RidA (YjgF/YER057c/UK114 family)